MAKHVLATRSAFDTAPFDGDLLIWYIVAALLALLFLFCFSRAIARLVSVIIRSYTRYYYNVDVKIQSLQISFLAGRIFFKGIRYHGENETVLIQDGYITWRYWIRLVRDSVQESSKGRPPSTGGSASESTSSDNGGTAVAESAEGGDKTQKRPCRIHIKCRGVQWFVYNRSPAYDAILRNLLEDEQNTGEATAHEAIEGLHVKDEVFATKTDEAKETGTGETLSSDSGNHGSKRSSRPSLRGENTSDTPQKPVDDENPSIILDLLPIEIVCGKGAMVIGSKNTRSVLTATFANASGIVEAAPSGPLDQYKQVIDLTFHRPLIRMSPNREYCKSQRESGQDLVTSQSREMNTSGAPELSDSKTMNQSTPSRTASLFSGISHSVLPKWIRRRRLKSRKKQAADASNDADTANHVDERWLGLSRYLEDGDENVSKEQERWKSLEYAQFPTICDSPQIALKLVWDVPGPVQLAADSIEEKPSAAETDINGSTPPEWSIDVRVKGGTLTYGPWADRQRASIQGAFVPISHKDAVPAKRLDAGQPRVSTVMKVHVELEEQVVVRVPTRESSKDMRWRGQNVKNEQQGSKRQNTKSHLKGSHRDVKDQGPDQRPYGWLDVGISSDSTITFSMALVASKLGFRNDLRLDLRGLEVSSSVNHDVLLRSPSQIITCDIGAPLEWAALRRWQIDIEIVDSEIFLLRDHIFLIEDLVNDWGSGPPPEFYTFVPFEYSIRLRFRNFKLFLNVNDNNIIDSPADITDNMFIILRGGILDTNLLIPMRSFRPTMNKVTFDHDLSDGSFELSKPPWNTQSTFLVNHQVAYLKHLAVNGTYDYYTSTSALHTDTMHIAITGTAPRMDMHGFLIRLFMKIKDNYFGEDMHFRTLEEYRKECTQQPDQSGVKHPAHISNDLDVILVIIVKDACAKMPCHLYAADETIDLEANTIEADLRVTNYYMDLAVTLSPVNISHSRASTGTAENDEGVQIFIDGVSVNGHRLFGLPPTEPTYVCNWDFDVGRIDGECSIDMVRALMHAGQDFAVGFKDAENAVPPLNSEVINDVTFLRARLQPIALAIRVDRSAFVCKLQKISFEFGDWADMQFSDRSYCSVRDVQFYVIDAQDLAIKSTDMQASANTHAYARAVVELRKVTRCRALAERMRLQQDHISRHDIRTKRTPWLLRKSHLSNHLPVTVPTKIHPPAMCFPAMPSPIKIVHSHKSDLDQRSDGMSILTSSSKSKSQSSFLLRGRKTGFQSPGREGRNDDRTGRSPFQRHATDSVVVSTHPHTTVPPLVRIASAARQDYQSNRHAGLSFSSPFKRPQFTLLDIQPEVHRLPRVPRQFATDAGREEASAPYPRIDEAPNGNSEEDSFLFDLPEGLQLFATPKALFLVTSLLRALEPRDPETLVDRLQIEVLADVRQKRGRSKGTSHIANYRLFCPFIGVRFVNLIESKEDGISRRENYDVQIDRLVSTSKAADLLPSKVASTTKNNSFSTHITLEQFQCSASESVAGQDSEQAVIGLSLQRPVAWLHRRGEIAAGASLAGIEVISASRKVDYISSLIRQTLLLVDALGKRFSQIRQENVTRLQNLVLFLVQAGDNVANPAFMNATPYLVRGDAAHLRSSDSWKMVARLRFVMQQLHSSEKTNLRNSCHQAPKVPATEAFQQVSQIFDQWRSQDLVLADPALLTKRLFRQKPMSPESDDQAPDPIRANVRIASVRILVDPGPHQNEVVMNTAVLGFVLFEKEHAMPDSDILTLRSAVEAYFTQIELRLNWSLCELVENIVQTVRATTPPPQERRSRRGSLNPGAVPHSWHAVFSTEVGLLNLETPSVNVVSACQALRVSYLLNADHLASLAVHAAAATSEVQSQSKVLVIFKLRAPSVLASRTSSLDLDAPSAPPWRVMGAGTEISAEIPATILEIIETADNVVRSEVCFIVSWMQNLNRSVSDSSTASLKSRTGGSQVHVTLVLDYFTTSITILPNLVYRIQSDGGKASFKSGMMRPDAIELDLDVKDQIHVFCNGTDANAEELSSLQIPPLKSRFTFDLLRDGVVIELLMLVEPIILEASAVHALVVAVNQPDIVTLGKTINQEIDAIQLNLERIFNDHRSHSKLDANKSSLLFYNALITLQGFAIHASTPESTGDESSAELDVDMGRIRTRVSNKESSTNKLLPSPNFDVELDAINMKLMRSTDSDSVGCGSIRLAVFLKSSSRRLENGTILPSYQVRAVKPTINVYAETAPVLVAVARHLQMTLKTINVSDEVRNLGRLGYRRLLNEQATRRTETRNEEDFIAAALHGGMYSLEITQTSITWKVGDVIPTSAGREREDLMLSIDLIDLTARRDNTARLSIQDFQLQMGPPSKLLGGRSDNSALMPEVIFNVGYLSTVEGRRLVFRAKGKTLDLRLTSYFLLQASDLRHSIFQSVSKVRAATESHTVEAKEKGETYRSLLGDRKLVSLLVSADFAGAAVSLRGREATAPSSNGVEVLHRTSASRDGRFNQFQTKSAAGNATLRSPGIALVVEYRRPDAGLESLNAEVHVSASSNTLYPTVVPLILEISSSVKEVVGESGSRPGGEVPVASPTDPKAEPTEDAKATDLNPLAILGNCSLNFGLRIRSQEFSLSCQPVARVAATTRFDDCYVTVNTVRSAQHGQFYALSAKFTGLESSVQHVYSRESSGGVKLESLVLSFMNSRHVSDRNGISAILNVSPVTVHLNAKQSQDFLLFREIWWPADLRAPSSGSQQAKPEEDQFFIVQKYQQVAATGAFLWNATVSVAELNVQLDMGQSLGKSDFKIFKLWVSSSKSSDWEQNLCLGFDKVVVESSGRMTGAIEWQTFRVRTSIQWPVAEKTQNRTPLIQASVSFDHLEIKAGFDYQTFLVARISSYDFLMYNVRDPEQAARDRLVGVLNGGSILAFCTTASASQALALYQAFQRLIQEKQAAFESSLRDLEPFMRRQSLLQTASLAAPQPPQSEGPSSIRSSLKLQTKVMVNLRSINLGVFPKTFHDTQMFKVEATGASAHFDVRLEGQKIHSTLGLNLGELRVSLSPVGQTRMSKTLGDVDVAALVAIAAPASGGTILKVPRVVAVMQTWQSPESNLIDYVFKSSFQGKVDVGWNYSRISYIRGMWTAYTRALAQRLGKPLPSSAVQITGLEEEGDGQREQEKITAVVNMPQSRYRYQALQPPIIETPQLRDMGDATPPLEWIGLHRDRLPNLTHQVVIVSLLVVAKDIDDAYTKILGTS